MTSSRKSSRTASYVDPYVLVDKILANGASASEIIMGFDLSLRKTGVAIVWNSGHHTLLIEPPDDLRDGSRLVYIERELRRMLNAFEPNYAVIEGYSYGSATGQFALGEVGGVARLALSGNNIPYAVVPPTTLKKYVTGSGNANKIAMALQLNKDLNIALHDDNEVDALCLAAMGSHLFHLDLLKFPSSVERDRLAEDVRLNPMSRPKSRKPSTSKSKE